MKINQQNYESYFVRYLDNDLTGEEAAEVQLFLQLHPELKNDLEAFRSTILQPDEQLVFTGKSSLKRSVHTGNYEEYFVRWIENDLSPAEIAEVNAFLQHHPDYNSKLNTYKSTILIADQSVVFPDKQRLKKKASGTVIPMFTRYVLTGAVAAGLVLLLLVKGVPWWTGNSDLPLATNESEQPALPSGNPESDGKSNQPVKIEDQYTSTEQSAIASANTPLKPKAKVNKDSPKYQINNDFKTVAYTSVMDPLVVDDPAVLPIHRRGSKAPYLVPVYVQEKAVQPQTVSNNSPGGWLSIASVVGTEILKLSGRGDLLKTEEAEEQPKRKEALTLSIQTKKFAFYHKFLNKNHSTNKN